MKKLTLMHRDPVAADGGLSALTLAGGNIRADLAQHIVDASLSCSTTEVSELSITVQDTLDSALQRSVILKPGAPLSFAGWSFAVSGWSTDVGDAGPTVEITAPSRYVQRLRGQIGAKSWGTQDISAWVAARAREVGLVPAIQSGLGRQLFIRDKPDGDEKPSTWDLMVEGAEVGGAFIFEHGNRLVMGRPSWLVSKPWGGRTWRMTWNTWMDYTAEFQGQPRFEYQDGEQTLTVNMLGTSRHLVRPGDRLILSGSAVKGRLPAGTWLVDSVSVSLSRDVPAELVCVRPVDPDKADPRTPEAADTGGSAARRNAGSAGPGGGIRVPGKAGVYQLTGGTERVKAGAVPSGSSSKVMAWARRVNGGSYDFDGGYGAQCVDLAKKYNAEVIRGAPFRGHGKDNARNAVRAGSYTWVGPGSAGRVGDIVSWAGSYGSGIWGRGYGHVAVVLQDKGSSLYVVEQTYGRTRIATVTKRGLVGYARPRRLP